MYRACRAASIVLLASALQAQEASRAGSISGYVRDAATGQAIDGAAITVDGGAPSFTDSQGRYRISGIPTGSRSLVAHPPGALSGQGVARRLVRVGADADATSNFRLLRLAALEGTLLDADKQPVEGAAVALLAKHYDRGRIIYSNVAAITTGAGGAYRFTGVSAGEPYILFAAGHALTARASDAGNGKLQSADTYYPNAAIPGNAEVITLLPDEVRSRIDIRQLRLPVYCVSGEVVGAPGPVSIVLTPVGDTVDQTVHISTQSDGSFHACGLFRGDYQAVFRQKPKVGGRIIGPNDPAFSTTILDLQIADRDLEHLRVVAVPQRSLRCQVEWSDAPPDGAGAVSAALQLKTLSGVPSAMQPVWSLPGVVTLPDPISEYFPEITLSRSNFYVKDILHNGQSVLYTVIQPGGGELRIFLGQDGASVNTAAVDADGKPDADANIALMPRDAANVAEFAAATLFGQTDQAGSWRSKSLAPGKYLIIATHEPLDLKAFHIDKLWAARSRAKEIELTSGSNLQVKLTVQSLSSH